jgi:hypothetical protein
MGLEKYFKTLENIIDVIAQPNLEMFQNMARMLKKKKKMKAKVCIPRLPNF